VLYCGYESLFVNGKLDFRFSLSVFFCEVKGRVAPLAFEKVNFQVKSCEPVLFYFPLTITRMNQRLGRWRSSLMLRPHLSLVFFPSWGKEGENRPFQKKGKEEGVIGRFTSDQISPPPPPPPFSFLPPHFSYVLLTTRSRAAPVPLHCGS